MIYAENILNYYHDLVGQESRMVHDIAYLGNKEQKFDISNSEIRNSQLGTFESKLVSEDKIEK